MPALVLALALARRGASPSARACSTLPARPGPRMPCLLYRCSGGVVLRNLDIDQSGFREALLVDGGAAVAPLIQDCRVKCSGDDAVNIGGAGGDRWDA